MPTPTCSSRRRRRGAAPTRGCSRSSRARRAPESSRACSRGSKSPERRSAPPRRCCDRRSTPSSSKRSRHRDRRRPPPDPHPCSGRWRRLAFPAVSKPAGQAVALTMKVASAGLTDVGRKRNHNEDSYLIDDELQLYVVADGMGGHAGGGTASRIAVETIDRELRKARDGKDNPFGSSLQLQDSPLPEVLRGAVEKACMSIFSAAQEDSRLAGMGTTVISLL